jgi:beta-ureidopropionase / N-carbamoyl-L-amino-acid hydrolase
MGPGGSRRAGDHPPIAEAELEALLADLVPIGLDEAGATTRLAWTEEDERAAGWFARRAEAIGRRMERDPAGNLWACPDTPPPWWAVGSHLDSVRGGGRFDGALGVAAGFAVAERLPVAVVSFADEEGARFNTPTFGSRALVGRLDVDDALDRVDEHGVTLGDAMAAAGVDPDRLGDAPGWLERLAGFVELHIDQTRDVAAARAPAGVVTRLAARLRLQVELVGRADHAGTTPREERHDALAAAARVIVRADAEAAQRLGMVFTAARMEVEPNSPTTVPSLVRLWLDARAPEPETVESWRETVALEIDRVAEEAGVGLDLRTAAWSLGTEFDRAAIAALGDALRPGAPRVVCYAGHDAGVIAAARPAGMVLVRNETGVSHSPDENVSLEDAAVAANGLVAAAEELAAR